MTGVNHLSFEAFDRTKTDEYAAEARKNWSDTPAYKEYERRREGRTREDEAALGEGLMELLARFHALKDGPADAPEARALVERLQRYITEYFYTCTPEALRGLGRLYAGGGRFTENIDARGGEGTAAFAAKAIEAYVG